MSLTFHYVPPAIGLAAAIAVTDTGVGMIGAIAVFTTVTIAVGLIGYYSPLPHHNGGWGMPPAKMQLWGFTTEPRDGYEEPSTNDIMRPAIRGGFMLANKKEDDDG